MTIPFFHTAAGLYLSETDVVWVAARRLGRRLRRAAHAREPVADGDVQDALRRLVARARPPHPYVVTHLDPFHVRHVVLQGGAFDDPTAFDAWLQDEAARHLPPHARLSDFVLRGRCLEQTEDFIRYLLALASRKAVEERLALLEAVGLAALGIGSLDVAIGDALWLNPALPAQEAAVLVVRPDEAMLLEYRQGWLQACAAFPSEAGVEAGMTVLQDAAARLTPRPDCLLVVGAGATALVERARAERLMEGAVQEGRLDFFLDDEDLERPAQALPAAALALQQLFPVPDAINFLEPGVIQDGLMAIEKREAARAALMLGGLVGVVFLLLMLVGVYLEGRQAAAEEALRALGYQVARVEQVREAVEQLELDIAHAEHLVVERTKVADALEAVGRAVGEDLWLEAIALEASRLTLTGTAFSEGALAGYLGRLEQAPHATNVRLGYAEAVRTGALYRRARDQDRTLTRFEIQMEIRPLVHDQEASN